ncbi:glycosyltransferase family 2 protein [Lutibacter citreus]|uniref:glycosyltransferase family 2 protein n=1 Tax=Lutibacter citreus TaxID=2138210 RepID=UPI000DBE3BD4|nr:glycosyltransferase family 2 protein [Lutibacter citreus]
MGVKEIAILLSCHNRKDKTIKCLNALYLNKMPLGYIFEVFLVDDGSTDGTGEAIKEKFPKVNIILGDGNLFWNRGMHLAWKTASKTNDYDFYLWLNDDTFIFDNCLMELLKSSNKEKNHKIITGTTCGVDNNKKITYGGRSKNQGLIIPNGENQDCDYFNGNIVLIPRYVYKKVGMNDFIFHHSLGDFDYGLRARAKGIGIVIAPIISGMCDENTEIKSWKKKDLPLPTRIKSLYAPQGNNPIEFFKYDYRHNGIIMACFHFLTIHMKVLFLF